MVFLQKIVRHMTNRCGFCMKGLVAERIAELTDNKSQSDAHLFHYDQIVKMTTLREPLVEEDLEESIMDFWKMTPMLQLSYGYGHHERVTWSSSTRYITQFTKPSHFENNRNPATKLEDDGERYTIVITKKMQLSTSY